jgi:hypothetical protein
MANARLFNALVHDVFGDGVIEIYSDSAIDRHGHVGDKASSGWREQQPDKLFIRRQDVSLE